MVKTGEQIQTKFALKYDAYVLMLRAKHMKYFSALKYAESVYMQYVLEVAMNQAISDYGLAWGQRGRFFDLTEKMFSGKEVTLQKWLDSGLPEELYNEMPSIFANIQSLYSFCKYPTSKLMSRITFFPLSQDVLFPSEEDYVTQTTELSESEKLDLPSEDSTASILEVKVCCHNIVNTLTPFLNPPLTDFKSWNLNPIFTILGLNHTVNNKTVILGVAVANPSVYNETPTLNISVVKTP